MHELNPKRLGSLLRCAFLSSILYTSLTLWAGNVALVPQGSVWKYEASGTDLGTAWREPGYDDAAWSAGPARLGYGGDGEVTLIPSAPVYSTYYFRHTFAVSDPALFSALTLRLVKDDGCVVYLNGTEVARYNMPAGAITFGSWASTATDYTWEAPLTLPNTLFAGNNLIAVEVHQGNATSSDIGLDLELVGTKPNITINLDAPNDAASGLATPVTLAATASSGASQQLTVSFYGRPAAANGPDFSIVVLPDTQFYTAGLNGGTMDMFHSQVNWILANQSGLNIAYVAHEGDISNDGDTYPGQWVNASSAMYKLDNAVPYGVAVGNHDQIAYGNLTPTTYYNTYFGADHFFNRSYYGGHYGGNNNNSYQLFSASGMDFIVLTLEYSPSAAALTWANGVLQANSNCRAILVTHSLLETTAAWTAAGSAIYEALKGNPNLFLMLCGHNHGEARRTDVYNGHTIDTVLADYQSYAGGGNGYLRILTFSPANNQIRFQTFSPYAGLYETDSNSEFTLSYQMGPNFTLIQQNSGVPSGTQTTATWSGLQFGTGYEWFVTADDGFEVQSSVARRFTTSINGNAAPTVTITAPAQGTTYTEVDSQTVALLAAASDTDGMVSQVEFFANGTSVGTATYYSGSYVLSFTFSPGTYTITAIATDDKGGTGTSAAAVITVGVPAPPGLLSVQAVTLNSVTLQWKDNSTVEDRYEVLVSTDGSTYVLGATVEANWQSATVINLSPGSSYHFKVLAVNGTVTSSSDVLRASTSTPQPPNAPSMLTARPFSNTEIDLSWTDNSSDETGFRIERSLDQTAWTTTASVGPNTTSYRDTGLTPGILYYYRVFAVNSGVTSTPTDSAAAAPFVDSYATSETRVLGTLTGSFSDTFVADSVSEQLTEKPTGAKSVRTSGLEHKWIFNLPSGGSSVFYVKAFETTSTDGDTFIFAYSADNVNFTDMALANASEGYRLFQLPRGIQGPVYIQVRDSDRTPNATALDTLSVDQLLIRTDVSPGTLPAPPSPPMQVAANPGDGTVTLSWAPVQGTVTIYGRTSTQPDYALIVSELTGTTYQVKGLVNGTTYEYVLVTVDAYGQKSGYSSSVSATPAALTSAVPEPPTGVTASASRKRITINWIQSITPGVTENRVYRSTDGSNFALLTTVTSLTTYADVVTSGSTYYYRVTAANSQSESLPSNVASATAR